MKSTRYVNSSRMLNLFKVILGSAFTFWLSIYYLDTTSLSWRSLQHLAVSVKIFAIYRWLSIIDIFVSRTKKYPLFGFINIGAVLLFEKQWLHFGFFLVLFLFGFSFFKEGLLFCLGQNFKRVRWEAMSWCKTYELYLKMKFLITTDCLTNGKSSCLREKIFPSSLSS